MTGAVPGASLGPAQDAVREDVSLVLSEMAPGVGPAPSALRRGPPESPGRYKRGRVGNLSIIYSIKNSPSALQAGSGARISRDFNAMQNYF